MDELEELEFRDGKRWVPKYLALTMGDLETYRYTYAEACKAANTAAVQWHVDNKLDQIISNHFKGLR